MPTFDEACRATVAEALNAAQQVDGFIEGGVIEGRRGDPLKDLAYAAEVWHTHRTAIFFALGVAFGAGMERKDGR